MGGGSTTLLLVHGYGCNQAMWRHLAPALAGHYRVALLDLVGFGLSDFSAYEPARYDGLDAHARDVAEVARALGDGPLVLVGHSVGAIVGLLAAQHVPGAIAGHVLVAPTPCLANDGDYRGGFERQQLEELLASQGQDMDAWSRTVATLVAGQAEWSPIAMELAGSFCRADRRAAAQLARAAFAGDHRALLPRVREPALILQCSEDVVAPTSVGDFMRASTPRSQLRLLDARGHCPHLTHPRECLAAMQPFLAGLAARASSLH